MGSEQNRLPGGVTALHMWGKKNNKSESLSSHRLQLYFKPEAHTVWPTQLYHMHIAISVKGPPEWKHKYKGREYVTVSTDVNCGCMAPHCPQRKEEATRVVRYSNGEIIQVQSAAQVTGCKVFLFQRLMMTAPLKTDHLHAVNTFQMATLCRLAIRKKMASRK